VYVLVPRQASPGASALAAPHWNPAPAPVLVNVPGNRPVILLPRPLGIPPALAFALGGR